IPERPDLTLVVLAQLSQQGQGFGAFRNVNARQPTPVTFSNDRLKRAAPFFPGVLGYDLVYQGLCIFEENTGGRAVLVARDTAAGRVGDITVDTCQFQCSGIEPPRVAVFP